MILNLTQKAESSMNPRHQNICQILLRTSFAKRSKVLRRICSETKEDVEKVAPEKQLSCTNSVQNTYYRISRDADYGIDTNHAENLK